jgi:hypothetical protein
LDTTNHTSISTDRIEAGIIILYAGEIAEKLYISGYNWEITRVEHRTASDLVKILGTRIDEREAYLDRLFLRAKELIKLPQNWWAVEALADGLLKNRTIEYRGAKQIIEVSLGGNG